jgi:hypothetical protein
MRVAMIAPARCFRAARFWPATQLFIVAIEATKKEGSRLNLLQILTVGKSDEDDSDGDDYDEASE